LKHTILKKNNKREIQKFIFKILKNKILNYKILKNKMKKNYKIKKLIIEIK